jgi:uncharacterized protein (TIGR02453 family)
MSKKSFGGFTLNTFKFLDQLQRNNNRDWFDKHKDQYEDDVRTPALEFIESMIDPMKKLSPNFRVEAKKVGGSLMRIYRDTRFSNDKTPYKNNIGIHFRHVKGKDVHAPGYYFHIDTEQVFLGAGIWHPDSTALEKIRKHIDKNQAQWKKIINAKSFSNVFKQAGDSLKRPPRGYAAEHPMIDELKRKDHIGLGEVDQDFVTQPRLAAETTKRFKAATAYMKFLCDALKLKF